MPKHRYYDLLPRYLKTSQNRRSSAISEDVLYDTESFEPIEGQIGNVDDVTEEDLLRNPLIPEISQERARDQLSVGVVTGEDGEVDTGVFYSDLIGQIVSNGGIVSNTIRLFDTDWFSWTPPIDIDKWTNFVRYVWTGEGDARVNGEYITKDPGGSKATLYLVEGPSAFTAVNVELSIDAVGDFTPGNTVGDLREDPFGFRYIYRWDGTNWNQVTWVPVSDLPTSTTLPIGTYLYVARSGIDFNRYVTYTYSGAMTRWIPRLVTIGVAPPSNPSVGMIWENCSNSPKRHFMRYNENGTWSTISHTISYDMTNAGHGTDGDCVYHAYHIDDVDDRWEATNWWVHYDDLSEIDQGYVTKEQMGIRPILQLWSCIEQFTDSNRTQRHDVPRFTVYAYKKTSKSILEINTANFGVNSIDTDRGCSIVQYLLGDGTDDPILGFPGSFNNTSEFKFSVTLENQTITINDGEELVGYRFYLDKYTGSARSIWAQAPADIPIITTNDEFPISLSNNPDHEVLTTFSRSEVLHNFLGIIEANSNGYPQGSNGYRWTNQSMFLGSTIIDCNASLLKPMALLLNEKLDLPDAIRAMGHEHGRFHRRFLKKLQDLWDSGEYSNPDDTFATDVTAEIFVDAVLTDLLAGKTENGAFWRSDMGTYVDYVTLEEKPIAIPASTARIGATRPYLPRKITINGTNRLIGHDGRIINAWDDDRDLAWLNLENRFYDQIPIHRITETNDTVHSATISADPWILNRYLTNPDLPELRYEGVYIVNDYSLAVPGSNYRVFSRVHGKFVYSKNGVDWETPISASIGDYFSDQNGDIFCFNGIIPVQYKVYNYNESESNGIYYKLNEFHQIIRREFERWTISRGKDPAANTTYVENDPFTWNYSAAGVEGHWRGIYRRIYHTDRPHSCPWEICGFSIEPEWWRTTYVPTSTATDGSPRYGSAHAMWNDLRSAGSLMPVQLKDWQIPSSDLPTPVDTDGELLDPIAIGIVDSLECVPTDTRNARWKYGDFSPIETEFWESPEGIFAVALCGYLMKPARFTETTWTDYYTPVGIGNGGLLIKPYPISVDIVTLTRPSISVVPVHGELLPDEETIYENPALVSWISEVLLMTGSDPKTKFGDIVRNARPALGWKCGGFINLERTNIRTHSGLDIPQENLNVLVHISKPRDIRFHSGMIFVKDVTGGYRVYGYNPTDPYFRIYKSSKPVVAGQVFLRQNFTSTAKQTDFVITNFTIKSNDIGNLSVLIDNYRIDNRYVSLDSDTNTVTISGGLEISANQIVSVILSSTQTTQVTRQRQFIVNGKTFFYYPVSTNEIVEYPYGHLFTTNQDVVEFIVDHGKWMHAQGWVYGTEEDSNIAKKDWLYVATRFANWSSISKNPGEIFIEVAGGKSIKFEVDHGSILDIESSTNGSYSIIDMGSFPIQKTDTVVSRIGGELTVECANKEIYGLRIRISEIEHAIFLPQSTKFNDLLYQPVTGLKHSRLLVKTYRSKDWKGRFEAPGHIIYRNELLPNFEKQVSDFSRFYDRTNPVDDSSLLDQAWNLYGWYRKPYMNTIGASLPVAFDYHRGMVRHKGTTDAFLSFAKGTISGIDGTYLTENWAWKVSDYGNLAARKRSRFSITEREVRDKLQIIRFVDEESEQDSIIEVLPYDRNNPASSKWIIPPSYDEITNLTFPVDTNGIADPSKYVYRLMLLKDKVEAPQQQTFTHWDPVLGLHSAVALSQIDLISPVDPARYNQGPKENRAIGFEWDETHVGKLWWNTSKRTYDDYHARENIRDRANNWGRLSYYTVESQVINDIDITITTSTNHDYEEDDHVILTSSDGARYEAIVLSVDDADSITCSVRFGEDTEPVLLDNFDVPIFNEVTKYDIEIYQWIESNVPPVAHPISTERVLDSSDPSYVEKTVDGVTLYYYWVKWRNEALDNKTLSALQIENQLRDPSSNGIHWFAPISSNALVFNTAGVTIENNALEVLVDSLDISVHSEWALIRENHPIERTPPAVIQKLVDSLLGVDELGGTIPSSLLFGNEKYGTSRWQTVFQDQTEAKSLFLRVLNLILSYRNRTEDIDFYDVFLEDEEGTWWSKADYLEEDMVNAQVSMIARTLIIRDSMTLMQENDLIKVLSAIVDPILGGDNYGYGLYKYDGSEWVEFGSANTTAKVNESIWDLENAGQKIKDILAVLLPYEESFVVFALIHEMMKQNKGCTWCFKTSLIDVTNTIYVSQPVYRPRDELVEILENVSEIKPFHSKVRDTSTIVYPEQEAVSPSIDDFNVHSIIQLNDRLSSNGFDDFCWDTVGWDIHPWDYQPWAMNDLGRDAWIELERFDPEPYTRVYNIAAGAYPGHELRVITYDSNNEVSITPSHTVTLESDTTVTVEFTQVPPQTLTYAIEQAYGAVYGNTPSLPAAITNQYDWLEPYESSYEHAAIRGQEYVTGADRTLYYEHDDTFGDATSLTGNDSGERIRASSTDRFLIQVDTYETPAYAGWDAVPWDLGQWDHVITNISPNKFYVTSDDYRVDVASYNESLTSQTLVGVEGIEYGVMTARQSNDRLNISSVTLENFVLAEGIDYIKLNNSTIQLFDRSNQAFTADFETRIFTASFAIDTAHVGSTSLVEDTDFTLDIDRRTIILINDSISGIVELVPYKVSTYGQVVLICNWLGLLSNDVVLTQTSQNFLLDSKVDESSWTSSNVSFTTGLDNPRAFFDWSLAGSSINVIDGSALQTGYVTATNYTGVGVPTPLCRRTVCCFVAKLENITTKCALKLKFSGDDDVEYVGIFDTVEGVFTAYSDGAHVTVDDVYDFWKISLEAQNNDSDNDTTEVFFYPAYNTDGSVTPDITTTGYNVVWGFQLYDPNYSVRYTYSNGTTVDSTSLSVDSSINPAERRIDFNEDTGNFIVYPGTVSVDFNRAYYLSSSPIDVDDVTDDRTTYYSDAGSFDEYLAQDGFRILDTSNSTIYERSSNAWVSVKVAGHRKFVSKRTLNTWSWNGSAWEEIESRLDSPFFEYQHGVAGSSIWYGRANKALSNRSSAVRADKFYLDTLTTTDVHIWSSARGGREEDIDGNVVHWYNTAAPTLTSFYQSATNRTPTFTLPSGEWKNSGLVFASSTPSWMEYLDPDDDFENVFSGGGTIIVVLTVDTLANSVITEKRNAPSAGWSLQLTSTGLIRFYKDFSTTSGQWTAATGSEFTTGAKYIVELTYDDTNVANNPVLKINGIEVALVENATPVGTPAGDAGLRIMLGINNDEVSNPLDGKMHEYILFKRELTTEESEEITSVLSDAWF